MISTTMIILIFTLLIVSGCSNKSRKNNLELYIPLRDYRVHVNITELVFTPRPWLPELPGATSLNKCSVILDWKNNYVLLVYCFNDQYEYSFIQFWIQLLP